MNDPSSFIPATCEKLNGKGLKNKQKGILKIATKSKIKL
jgi:hypothetical protein